MDSLWNFEHKNYEFIFNFNDLDLHFWKKR
jgi:hypothetical protein